MTLAISVWDLPAPALEFGGKGEYLDPKRGLLHEGPFSLRFGVAHKSQVRVGVVGTAKSMAEGAAWLERCKKTIAANAKNEAMYPDFPGFEGAFKSSLDVDSRWQLEIDGRAIERALKMDARARFETLLDLYGAEIERLSKLDVRPDLAVCCIPPEVITSSHHLLNIPTPRERKALRRKIGTADAAQLSLFDEWDFEEKVEDLLYRDFRRALKARAMLARLPIQLGTSHLFQDSESNQDPATRAWNVSVAIFYKAGGIPWRLKIDGPETCFVGISFHHLFTNRRHLVYSSLAQAFSSDGDGFALRGDAVPWTKDQDRHPHLSSDQAGKLITEVLDEYRKRTGVDPVRVVLHKTSNFDQAERTGFLAAMRRTPQVELINLMPSEFRLVQRDAYPPRRGTLCRVNRDSVYLFTTGYIPDWGTYPGPHIPAPIRIVTDPGVDVYRVAREVLGLSRMNWNTARDTSGQPITLRFAREIGGIMAEVGASAQPHPSYRFYM